VVLAALLKKLATVEVPGNILLQLKVLRMDGILQTPEAAECAMRRVTRLVVVVVWCAALQLRCSSTRCSAAVIQNRELLQIVYAVDLI